LSQQEHPLLITRRALGTLLSLAGLAAASRVGILQPVAPALALDAADLAKPVSLPDMVLGAASAPVTVIEYASPTCPHCAAFDREVFPKIKAAYVDTGKVRYVFREFSRNVKDVACEMLARRIADGDPNKYFAVVETMFRQQDGLFDKTTETLKLIGKQAGLSAAAVEDCLRDQALMDRIEADQKFAVDVLKVPGTPTFFINGEAVVGAVSFEEFESKIKPLLKS
jgi:protein-disulfide isomerase